MASLLLGGETKTNAATTTTPLEEPPNKRSRTQLFGIRDCPKYVVDLDAPPGDRWNHVVAAYKDQLPAVVAMADDILGTGIGATIATTAFATAANVGWVYYGDELKGIAKATGIPLGRVVLLQIAYEAFAACTSIVVDGPDGHPLHIRTMDWEMPELQPLTIEVDFIKGGVLVHRATTWAGYVGVLTGVRVQGFSVSVNYRRSLQGAQGGIKGILHNLTRGLAGHWPVSFLVREVLETEDNYPDAVKALQQSELMAPVYLTIAGVSPGEGCVLTRDRKAVVDGSGGNDDGGINSGGITEQLGNGTTVVVQTNMDIPLCDKDNTDDDWQDICASRVRRRFAKAALHGLGEGGGSITMDDLWKLVSFAPCKAHDTVYTTSMVPRTGELVTRVYPTRKQRAAGKKKFKGVRVVQAGSSNGRGATRQ